LTMFFDLTDSADDSYYGMDGLLRKTPRSSFGSTSSCSTSSSSSSCSSSSSSSSSSRTVRLVRARDDKAFAFFDKGIGAGEQSRCGGRSCKRAAGCGELFLPQEERLKAFQIAFGKKSRRGFHLDAKCLALQMLRVIEEEGKTAGYRKVPFALDYKGKRWTRPVCAQCNQSIDDWCVLVGGLTMHHLDCLRQDGANEGYEKQLDDMLRRMEKEAKAKAHEESMPRLSSFNSAQTTRKKKRKKHQLEEEEADEDKDEDASDEEENRCYNASITSTNATYAVKKKIFFTEEKSKKTKGNYTQVPVEVISLIDD